MTDNRRDLIEALLAFGKQAEKIAGLLSLEIIKGIDDNPTITPNLTKALDPTKYQNWPVTECVPPPIIDIEAATVLEFHRGPTLPIAATRNSAKLIHLLTDTFRFEAQPNNVSIIHNIERQYDIGVISESLEFVNNPIKILAQLKACCRKILIRMRPWTSRDGGFLKSKAFLHLATNTNSGIQVKIIKPLAYEEMLNKIVTIQERHINHTPVEPFFKSDDILSTIIDRTWGVIRPEDALNIMSISSIDYVVC